MVSTWKSYIVEREGSWQHSLVTCQQLQYRGFFPVKASQTYRHIIACYRILYCTHPLIQLKYIGITRCTICRPSIHHSPPAVNFGEGEQGERRRLCPSHSWRWPLSCRQWKGTCMTIVYWIVGHWSTHNYSEESLSWWWPLSWNSGDWGTYTTEVSNIQYTTHTHSCKFWCDVNNTGQYMCMLSYGTQGDFLQQPHYCALISWTMNHTYS